ncbi:probable WRKY transcription factor 4 [Actinidia eriantha]|uniref:probable WRKY transcription factor 4 n=1 Tax=Actinidia eriantha TaxID=165200 RepID=UPI00258EABB2|nr:probable WRKY transcription factor 4 [Actinidia eriantha]
MAENQGSSSSSSSRASSAHLRPTINPPPRTSLASLFTGGLSPGPMTLVSNFFSESDPDSDCRSFSQLLAGAMTSPASAAPGHRPKFPAAEDKVSGGDVDFRFKKNRPTGLMIAQSQPMFMVPPGLSPASLLDSPGLFSAGQAPFGMSHQQVLAQVTAQASQAHSHMHNQSEFPSSLSAAPAASLPLLPSFTSNLTIHQQMPPSMPEPSIVEESSDLSHPDQRSQPSSLVVDKPADDGYNWRKYGQKQVKGSEFPRSYYKCTHPNCPVKKKVERSLDGQITEIIYKGQHNHQPPQSSKRAKDGGNPNGSLNNQGNSELSMEGRMGDLNKMKERLPAYSLSMKDQESSQAIPEHLQGSSDSEEVGESETRVDERDEDEPEAKRRNTEARISEPVSSHRTVAEPRIIVQTTSEVDLLDDGYRWRKYGQKIVKGNPYPRSYYKCTSQGCNVRKHVERAASDPKAVVTTYEGKHNHDVPAARNSSHNTANNSLSQLKPHSAISDKHTLVREREFGKNDSQPSMLRRFKEELT